MGIWSNLKKRFYNTRADTQRIEMVTLQGNGFYAWNGKLFKNDLVRACIRPYAKAAGKMVPKHIQRVKNGVKINPEPYIRFLLEEPNPYMGWQVYAQKMATTLKLNGNAFALILRDENGYPTQLYPIPCIVAEAKYNDAGELMLKFTFKNGKTNTFLYSDIIHLREDFNENDIFGTGAADTLSELMEVVTTTDQALVKAVKNSAVIRWLLKFHSSTRPEDVKKNVKYFVDNYLSVESDMLGVAGVDTSADAIQIQPNDYVPNAAQTDRTVERIYSFFNTNKKIVQSNYTEDEWTSYYESELEPFAKQCSQEYTRKLFTRKDRARGNEIVMEAYSLQCASLTTKLNLVQMVDRGALTPNEWREILNLTPTEGGDKPIRRLDTETVNLAKAMMEKMTDENCSLIMTAITKLTGGENIELECLRSDSPECL